MPGIDGCWPAAAFLAHDSQGEYAKSCVDERILTNMHSLRHLLQQAQENGVAIGHFNISGLVILKAEDCVQHFGGNPDVLFAVAGDLSISAVPVPRSSSLFICDVLATGIEPVSKAWKRLFY